jgi:hypothetical protein
VSVLATTLEKYANAADRVPVVTTIRRVLQNKLQGKEEEVVVAVQVFLVEDLVDLRNGGKVSWERKG